MSEKEQAQALTRVENLLPEWEALASKMTHHLEDHDYALGVGACLKELRKALTE